MTMLYWILGLIGLGLLGRYVPGFKCISFCRYKGIQKKRAIDKLRKICDIEEKYDNNYRATKRKTLTVNTDGYTAKRLEKLYKNTLHFGCKSFNEEDWVPSARDILKERLAEYQLLGV